VYPHELAWTIQGSGSDRKHKSRCRNEPSGTPTIRPPNLARERLEEQRQEPDAQEVLQWCSQLKPVTAWLYVISSIDGVACAVSNLFPFSSIPDFCARACCTEDCSRQRTYHQNAPQHEAAENHDTRNQQIERIPVIRCANQMAALVPFAYDSPHIAVNSSTSKIVHDVCRGINAL
jgi:hypothetical protein